MATHYGRIIGIHPGAQGIELELRNLRGTTRVPAPASSAASKPGLGDIVEVSDSGIRILTPNRAQGSMKKMESVLNPRRLAALKVRNQVEAFIRLFFLSRDFLETRTPLLVPSPGMEPHIRPFRLESGAFLPTSPEFAMKRLLVGGLERIFQISSSFRFEPVSPIHHPEFQMLEWYRAYSGYEAIMKDTEELFEFIAKKKTGSTVIRFGEDEIDLKTPWPRTTVRELFLEHTGLQVSENLPIEEFKRYCEKQGLLAPSDASWDDLYFLIWLNEIEPRLPKNRPLIIYHYPPSQAALAVTEIGSDGNRWAKRFEFYIAGIELGNAFEELTDPVEQRARFLNDQKVRKSVYGDQYPESPIDEDFLDALAEGMPPSGGIAVGVDRMVQLFANEPELEKTLWLMSEPGSTH